MRVLLISPMSVAFSLKAGAGSPMAMVGEAACFVITVSFIFPAFWGAACFVFVRFDGAAFLIAALAVVAFRAVLVRDISCSFIVP